MARPPRLNVDYFPFICKEGKTMHYIETKYGNDGYATWVKILRLLAVTNNHYLNLSKKAELMFIASKCKITEETLNNIINDLVDLGKFNDILWKENKIIWCQDFIDSIEDAYKKRNNKCITFEGLGILLSSLGIRKPSLLPLKGNGNTQSKVEYSKVEYSIEDRKSEFKNSLSIFLDDYDSHLLNEFYSYWSEHNEKGRKMRFEMSKNQPFNIKRRLVTFLKNSEKWKKEKNFALKKEKESAAEIIHRVKNGTYE